MVDWAFNINGNVAMPNNSDWYNMNIEYLRLNSVGPEQHVYVNVFTILTLYIFNYT